MAARKCIARLGHAPRRRCTIDDMGPCTLIAADLVPASHLVGEGGDPGPINRTWTRSLKKALDECCQPVHQSTSADSTRRRRSRDLPGAKKKDDRNRGDRLQGPRPPSTAGPQPVEMMGGFNRMIKKKRRTRDEPQRIVTTRLLCRLQHPVRHPSRMQGLYSDAR